MSRIASASFLALSLIALPVGSAFAQSYTAPAGIPETTAPGSNVEPRRAVDFSTRYDAQTTGSVSGDNQARKPVRR